MCVCMNDHELCFFFKFYSKFTDGKEGGGGTMLAMKNAAIALSLFCVIVILRVFFLRLSFFLWPSLEALCIQGRLVTPVNAVLWGFLFFFSSLWEDTTSFIVSESELNWCMSWPEKWDHRKWVRLVMKKSHKDGRVTNGFSQDSLFLLIRHTQSCSLSHFLLWAVRLIEGFYGG